MSQHVFRIGGRDYRAEIKELTAEKATVVVDGTEYAVELVQLGRRRPADVVRTATASLAPPTAAAPPAVRSASAPRGEGGIVAPMPGLVLGIRVKEGEGVAAGQTLMVMEAMKMENAITTPYAGTVSRIYVREGDSISEGDLLVEVARPKLTTL